MQWLNRRVMAWNTSRVACLDRVIQGNNRVRNRKISSLYTAHRSRLLNYACGITGDTGRAEDVVQEAFLRFRAAATERLLDEPVGYLYRIVRNLALDGARRQTLEQRHISSTPPENLVNLAENRPSPEAEVMARQELAKVAAALNELPERTRIALEMHRLGGFKLREIADHLGVSISMAQTLVMEGVRHCQRSL